MNASRGVALLTVLLVVAVVSTVGVAMITRQQLVIRATGNQRLAQQMRHYQFGGEALARELLARDRRGDAAAQPRDDLGEAWARPLPVFPVEGGAITLRIEDLAGRFNLNNLVHDGQRDPLAQARFERLLRGLSIAPAFATKLADWIAPSGSAAVHGAPPWLAHRPLADVSELRLLGLGEANYRRLAPHVAALPGGLPINVNTADAMVLASLAEGMTPADGVALVVARGERGYASVAEFAGQPRMVGVALSTQGLAVHSDWFAAWSEVRLGDHRQAMRSVLRRERTGEVRVLRRDLGQDLDEGGMPGDNAPADLANTPTDSGKL